MLVLLPSNLQHIRPHPTLASMAVPKMLPKIIRPEEILRKVAFSEPVHNRQVLNSSIAIGFSQGLMNAWCWLSIALKFATAVSTSVQPL